MHKAPIAFPHEAYDRLLKQVSFPGDLSLVLSRYPFTCPGNDEKNNV